MNELNPQLYRALERRFGSVTVSNPGERLIERKIPDPLRPGKYRQNILRSGEYYRVNCPYCGDRRGRLYINYRWNTRTRDGDRFGRNLAICFNEGCDLTGLDLELGALARNWPVVDRPYASPVEDEPTFALQVLPGVCHPLDTLPSTHVACQYVLGRGFDPLELGKLWGVCYCSHCEETDKTPFPNLVKGRLVIPIFRDNVLVGWQTRAIKVEDGAPKYYTMPGFPKSRMLFNQDRARHYFFGVVVEGVFDAFRAGPRAVALFGKSMSQTQRELAVAFWGQGALCLMLDGDALEDMERLSKVMDPMRFKNGSFIVAMPHGEDPGGMDRDELWRLIIEHARNKGVQLA